MARACRARYIRDNGYKRPAFRAWYGLETREPDDMPNQPDWRSLYPFASHFLQLDAGRLHYLDEGQGRPLLMVHGNPTWSFHWRNLVTALRGNYRIVAPDHLGCGLSDKPRYSCPRKAVGMAPKPAAGGETFDYRLASHIDNLSRLISRLDLRDATLVAQDWGGAIGLGAMLRSPERFTRIVLFNTAAFRDSRMPWRIRICRTPGLGAVLVCGLNGFARAALHLAIEHPQRMTPEVQAGYLFPYDSWRNRIAIDRFVNDIPMNPRHPSYATLVEIERGLPSLADRPIQLIWGMRDWCFTPHFLDRFVEFFPRADVHRLADAGHWVVEDASEKVIQLVERFLATTKQAASGERR